MADWNLYQPKLAKLEGGYQNDPNDSGNYCDGQLIGTKYGISAPALSEYLGRCPSALEMQNLDRSIANQIFKTKYWDRFNGDNISNQSVAEIMFDFVEGSGASQLANLKAIANTTAGKTIISVNTHDITDSEASIINSLDQETYFNNLKSFRADFFQKIVQENPNLQEFLQGWENRISKYVFVSNVKKN